MDYNGYKIVCYYGAWAVYRQKPMAFNVTDIDPHACTHLIYAFAGLDEATNKIVSLDPKVDIEEGKNEISQCSLLDTHGLVRIFSAIA